MTRPKLYIVAGYIRRNLAARMRLRAGKLETDHGATHCGLPLEKSLAYIEEVFTDYLRYGGLSPECIRDWRVLEIGPGDNLGVALKLVSAGAGTVVAIDKFYARRDQRQQLRIYSALRERCPEAAHRRFDAAVNLTNGVEFDRRYVDYRTGIGIEDAPSHLPAASFDLIVSRAVLMEVPGCAAAFAAMDRLLRPGGVMIHKIAPLQDYGMFRGHGYHPLEFLTIAEPVYCYMASHAGMPNRRLLSFYRGVMAQLGYDARVHIVSLAGQRQKLPPGTLTVTPDLPGWADAATLVRAIRPRLAAQFRGARDEDFMAEDFFLVARKPN